MTSTIHTFKRFNLSNYSTWFTSMCFEVDAVKDRVSNIRIVCDDYHINIDGFSLSFAYNYDYNTLLDMWDFYELEPTSLKYKEHVIKKDVLNISSCKMPENEFDFKAIHFYRIPDDTNRAAFALLHENKHCILLEDALGRKNKPKPTARIMRYVIS